MLVLNPGPVASEATALSTVPQPVPIFILNSSFSFQDKRQSQSRPFWLKSCGLYLPKWTLAEMTFTFNFVEKKVFFAILVENFWLNALIVLML